MNDTINNSTILQERDTMPVEVATSMLTTPGAKLTNRMCKNCHSARARVFVPTEPRKPIGDKLQGKFAGKTWLQLHAILNRATARRAGVQKEYERIKAMKMPEPVPGLNSTRAAAEKAFERLRKIRLNMLDQAAATQELIIDLAEEEIAKRPALCK